MKNINVLEAKELIEKNLKNKNFELIDVRTLDEYKAGHLENSRHLPLDKIENWSVTLDRKKEYLIYCRSGGRSAVACSFLKQKQINADNLQGGILDWEEKGFYIEK